MEDGARPFAGATIDAALRRGPLTLRKRGSPTGRRRPQGFRPKGRDMAAAPESDSSPTPRSGPGGGARLSHASPLDDLASPAWCRATGPALGVPKARALETVKKDEAE
jgi:hypothetical protein